MSNQSSSTGISVGSARLTGTAIFGGSPIGGVTVTLLDASGNTVTSTVSDGTGTFSFANLAAGAYQVRYAAPSGEVLLSGPANDGTGLTDVLTLAAGQTLALTAETLAATGPTGSISGNTSLFGPSYPSGGVVQGNVTVALVNAAGTVVATTVSSASAGWYVFRSVLPGNYQLRFTTPSGELIEPGSAANVSTGLTAAFTVAPGQSYVAPNAGFVQAAGVIGGTVLSAGAAGANLGEAGVGVALLNAAGTVVATTTTSAAGAFSFSGFAAGTYELRYTAPAGQALRAGGPADQTSGLTAPFTLAAGQSISLAAATLATGASDVGVYVNWPGASTFDASLDQYTATVGAAPGYLDIGVDYTQPMSNWVGNAQAAAGHLAATTDVLTMTPVVALPLISSVGNGQSELQNLDAIASGADDSVWLGVVQAYQAAGYATIDLRIGWEQNGTWYPWSVSTPAEAQAYIAAFQHIATLVHGVSGIKVDVVWNPSEVDGSAVATQASYPGNAYVDIIGLDLYDSVYPLGGLYDWSTHKVDATLAQWEANPVNLAHYWNYPDATSTAPTGLGGGFGLAEAMQFAQANGKPFALPETGAGGNAASPPNDTTFPEYLASALLAAGGPTIAFANIWDYGAYAFSTSSNPAMAAAWADFVRKMDQGDAGPTASAGSTIVGHGQTVDLGGQIAALIVPGQPGDSETITAVSTTLGTVTLGSGGTVLYAAPANGTAGGTASLTYTVSDQLGDVASFTDAVAIDPGPSGGGGSITVGHGQALNLTSQILGKITPGFAGDSETITAIRASAGTVTVGAAGAVTYQSPASGTATLNYTVTDQAGDSASFSTALVIDPGPTLAAGGGSIVQGMTAALGPSIAALITPGLAGDSETVTAVSAARGSATLGANGAISYTAPGAAGADTLTYTVVDGHGDTATGSYAINVLPTPGVISGNTSIYGPSYPSWGGIQGNVTVALIDAAGDVVATTVSSASAGWYIFRTVTPGTYQLRFTSPSGEVFKPGGTANVTTGLTAAFTVAPGQSYIAPNAGFVAAAAITGSTLLAGAGVAGVSVAVLDSAGNVLATTTTGSTGAFAFNALEAGTYRLRYTAPSGDLLQSGPANAATGVTGALTLTAGQTLALGAETLALATGTITGSALLQGAAQAGVTVTLVDASGNTVTSTTSGGNGAFSFANVPVGTYQVRYTAPSGEVLQSGPANAGTGLTGALTLAAGQTLALGAETLAPAPGTITGLVLLQGATQTGVTVTLLDASGNTVTSTVSDGTGRFSFANLAAGAYQVCYAAPSGEVLLSGPANDGTGLTGALTLAAGQTLTLGAETLAPAPGTITGSVLFQGTPQAGVTVTLLDASGDPVASTVSDGNGTFSFTNLAAGAYQVRYTAPSGEVLQSGPANAGTGLAGALTLAAEAVTPFANLLQSGPASDATGLTNAIKLVAGQTLALGAETLAPAPGTITGSVLFQGAPQTGVTVTLLDASGTTVASTVSNNAGAFSFANLAAGAYQVRYTAPSGEVLQYGPANAGTGLTNAIKLAAGQTLALGAETLAPAPGTITGSVLLQGAPQTGVTVTLLDASGNTAASTVSNNAGAFSFANLAAGAYQVRYTAPSGEVLQYGPANAGTGLTGALTLAAGQTLALGAETLGVSGAAGNVSGNTSIYGPSYPSWGGIQGNVAVALVDDAGDVVATTVSSAGGGWYIFRSVLPGSYQLQFTAPSGEFIKPGSAANVTTGLTAAFTVAPGQSYIAPNAGFVAAAAITGSTLLAGAGVSGETVTLLNAAGAAVATTTTNTAGAFSFTGLQAGTYQVRYAAPPGAALETGSEANAATGLTPALTLASGQTLSLPAELLLSNPATVQSDVLHFGGPADPAAGGGEAGVTVSLLNAAGSVIASTTTGAGGTFSFGQLAAGTYQLQYAAPSGQATAPGAPESAAGLTAAFTVAAGQTVAAPAGALISAIAFNGSGASTVAGAGSYLVTGNANHSMLTLGAGNQTVTLTGSTDTVVTGDGNQTITLAGTYNHVTVGTGASTITAGSGYSSVHAAGGTVTINAGGPGNLFDGGTGPGSMSFLNADGSAGNVFMLNAAGQGLTTITGFNPAASDVLDLHRTLAGTGILPDMSNIASFVTAAATGANTTLYVDPTGGQATPQVFAVLNGVHTTVAQLQAAHAFSLT